jgi:hypothetical protein
MSGVSFRNAADFLTRFKIQHELTRAPFPQNKKRFYTSIMDSQAASPVWLRTAKNIVLEGRNASKQMSILFAKRIRGIVNH